MRLVMITGLMTGCAGSFDDVHSPARTTPETPEASPEDPTSPEPTPGDTEDPVEEETSPPEDPCPPGVICVDSFPYTHSSTTTNGTRDFDAYSCAPDTDESGPEVVYRVTLSETGFLGLGLDNLASGVDVDVHLLQTDDADDCIDRGHWIAGSLLEPGDYWVVVDSWVNNSGSEKDGSYTLNIGHTTAAEFAIDGLSEEALGTALLAFDEAWYRGETDRLTYGIIDFSVPSDERRFWLIDLETQDLLYHEYVTHGENSSDPNDIRYAVAFSNITDSHQSSLGLMRGGEIYGGSYGYSMRLDGLEDGFNDRVRSRYIVVHPATYATESFVNTYGYLGQSWGCPAFDPAVSDEIVDYLAEGGLMLTYYPDNAWLSGSEYL